MYHHLFDHRDIASAFHVHAVELRAARRVFLLAVVSILAIAAFLLAPRAASAATVGEIDAIRAALCFDDAQPECARMREIEENYVQRLTQMDRAGTLSPSRQRTELRRFWRRLQGEKLVAVLVVDSGETFTVALPSNPSTGYAWTASFDEGYLAFRDKAYVGPARALPGAGGEERFRFDALKNGVTAVAFRYARSWESGPAAQVRAYLVHVR